MVFICYKWLLAVSIASGYWNSCCFVIFGGLLLCGAEQTFNPCHGGPFTQEPAPEAEALALEARERQFVNKGFQSYDGVRTFFSGRSPTEIEQLQFHKDPKIAVFSAWIHCWHNVESSNRQGLDYKGYRREFAGFFSGKVNVTVPDWWRDCLCELGPFSMQSTTWPKSQGPWHNELFSLTNAVIHQTDLTITEVDEGRIRCHMGGRRFDVSLDELDLDTDASAYCVALLPKTCGGFYSAVSLVNGRPIYVCCYNSNGEGVWKSRINYSAQSITGGSGKPVDWTQLEIRQQGDAVVVFGANRDCIFADAFAIENGKHILSFTNLVDLIHLNN